MDRVLRPEVSVQYRFPVVFTRDVFDPCNAALREVAGAREGGASRFLAVLDSGVVEADPGLGDRIRRYAREHGAALELVGSPLVVRGGEACKADPRELERIHSLVHQHGLCRQSFVLVVGGGAVLDAAGYAAATAHRGLRLVRLPTTVLAQCDAGVGVKNGVNAFGRKNFLGTFVPPFAVVNDFRFLETLPLRERRSGVAEAVKVALIRDRGFFDRLYRERHRLASLFPEALEEVVIRCAELHLEHITTSGDPFESGSARPLDFGHWSAHKLEELTRGELRHGEAVAIGVALDSLYSHRTGLVSEIEVKKVLRVLEALGFDLWHPALEAIDVQGALGEFREHLGGRLHITLLRGLGARVEVHEIDRERMEQCIRDLGERGERTRRMVRPSAVPDGRGDRGLQSGGMNP
ncbi:MAG: 3-dehydroquinate synthase [Proteobacteria bacterium]|nr:3-dehydroquinate synthase [Pseudomonadota bacterium]